ncbi:MAG: redoxin domain-containing protein [Candidatus Solibacter usitatus]|nr:redoxin domain-containing protein [Candidatus Solibacter usitatus]
MRKLLACLLTATLCGSAAGVAAFELRDIDGLAARFETSGKTTVVLFYSTVCPISNEYNQRMNALFRDYSAKGAQFLVVNANWNESAQEMREHSRAAEFVFPVYRDHNNALAERLGASLTPEAFVLDGTGAVRYHGAIDDARNLARVKLQGLRDALESVMAGTKVMQAETKAFGCTIKKVKK